VTRKKIYDSQYWQQHCFYLTAETLVDKAVELRAFGGASGGMAVPSDFLCLLLKMLLIQPEPAIPLMFLEEKHYRYVRLLGAFYIRLTAKPKDIYELLEPIYLDYRKMRQRNNDNTFSLVHMDECIDQLLHGKQFCNIHLPPMVKRYKLEEAGILQPRISPLQAEVEVFVCGVTGGGGWLL
jgi:pre-mRNA-splicing factor 38A